MALANTLDLIYKLENVSADEGAPNLIQFGELIRSANAVWGYEQKIDVRIKPFAEGSWITEYIIQSTYLETWRIFCEARKAMIYASSYLFGTKYQRGIKLSIAGVVLKSV